MANPLRLGVIGLGRRWRRRYEPAVRALPGLFAVRAVYDQVYRQAEQEGRRLGCEAMGGPSALLEREDIDALLLCDAQWFGLWPLELACQRRKPVLCCIPLTQDEAHADALQQHVRESGLPVLVEWLPHLAPATARLAQLLRTELGAPRLVIGNIFRSESGAKGGAEAPEPDAGSPLQSFEMALLDWCAELVGGEPVSVWAMGSDDSGLLSHRWEFANGRVVHIIQHALPRRRHRRYVEIVAERGTANVTLPRRVRWTAVDGDHMHVLPRHRPVGQEILERFYQTIRDGRTAGPTFHDAYRVLRWLRAAQRSRLEARRVELTSPSVP